jgi:hypothetical protein
MIVREEEPSVLYHSNIIWRCNLWVSICLQVYHVIRPLLNFKHLNGRICSDNSTVEQLSCLRVDRGFCIDQPKLGLDPVGWRRAGDSYYMDSPIALDTSKARRLENAVSIAPCFGRAVDVHGYDMVVQRSP